MPPTLTKSWKDKLAQDLNNKIPTKGLTKSKVISTVMELLPEINTGNFAFSADSEFLNTILIYHVNRYFTQILALSAKRRHNIKNTGRLIRDDEIEEASTQLTSLIFREIGSSYITHMSKYFGDEEGLIAYTYNRVHDLLVESSCKHNEDYIKEITRKNLASAIAEG
jgi:hypothetical protein